ncbi:sugar transferase [Novosphingobium panipatense]|uniref:Sugar transferase involved in LPS biosynthesis (Colanic, teichoic acid) n=1 Tax=Novosphingobium panipatense TaxID=428991 RepID=A0ABY1QIB9_9SPHN|nr:sugar transferase [Novosphingobium panipatense]SMP71831.1 Sugar transferase involved in LPS biosynthesis (colanic, teichoic acid) [Novosphingobium panipatense]
MRTPAMRLGQWMARGAAGILLMLALPLLVLLAGGVLLSLGRPVLFRQQRAGRGGVPFTLLKLRSMRNTCDASGRPLPDEARVTPFGRFLRRSRLDELPGLWNVVAGDMAFVGPRPLLPETIAALAMHGVQRGAVRPGLTGWSQVNGNTLLALEEKIALDLWYVAHSSPLLDLRILLLTVWVMVGGERRA